MAWRGEWKNGTAPLFIAQNIKLLAGSFNKS